MIFGVTTEAKRDVMQDMSVGMMIRPALFMRYVNQDLFDIAWCFTNDYFSSETKEKKSLQQKALIQMEFRKVA